jgi:hypothetical protein
MQRRNRTRNYENAEQHALQDHHFKAEEIMTPELQEKIKSHIKRS